MSLLLLLSYSFCPQINTTPMTNSRLRLLLPSLGSDMVFCHPIKALIYCISQIGILVIYILSSLSVLLPQWFSSTAPPSSLLSVGADV